MLSHPHLCRKSVSTTGHITSHFISRLSWFYIIARWTRGLFGWLVYSRQPTPNGFLQYKPWKSNTKQRMALILQVNNLKQPTAGTLFSLSHRTHVVESGQSNLRETPPPAAVSPRRQEKAAHRTWARRSMSLTLLFTAMRVNKAWMNAKTLNLNYWSVTCVKIYLECTLHPRWQHYQRSSHTGTRKLQKTIHKLTRWRIHINRYILKKCIYLIYIYI